MNIAVIGAGNVGGGLANAAFLRLPRSGNHHDLGLFGVGQQAPPKHPRAIGLYHLWAGRAASAPIDRLDLQAEIDRWSGVRTAGQIVAEMAAAQAPPA